MADTTPTAAPSGEPVLAWLSRHTDRQRRSEIEFDDPKFEYRRLFSEVWGTFLLVLVAAGGGVIGAEGGPPAGVLYLIDVESAQQATAFAEADPYVDLYSSVRVEPFCQRLPDPATTRGHQ